MRDAGRARRSPPGGAGSPIRARCCGCCAMRRCSTWWSSAMPRTAAWPARRSPPPAKWPRRLGLPSAPAEAEALAVARDIALAEMAGARLHLRQVTTARRARSGARGQGARRRGDRRGHPGAFHAVGPCDRAISALSPGSRRRCAAKPTARRCSRRSPTARSTSSPRATIRAGPKTSACRSPTPSRAWRGRNAAAADAHAGARRRHHDRARFRPARAQPGAPAGGRGGRAEAGQRSRPRAGRSRTSRGSSIRPRWRRPPATRRSTSSRSRAASPRC